jgi:hypothetical protein
MRLNTGVCVFMARKTGVFGATGRQKEISLLVKCSRPHERSQKVDQLERKMHAP